MQIVRNSSFEIRIQLYTNSIQRGVSFIFIPKAYEILANYEKQVQSHIKVYKLFIINRNFNNLKRGLSNNYAEKKQGTNAFTFLRGDWFRELRI